MLVRREQRDERLGEGVLVVAVGLNRQDERVALLEPDHGLAPRWIAVGLDQLDVRVEVLERPADRGTEVARGGDGEADRRVRQPVGLEREVLAAAPQALVPARADRAGDPLECLLDAVRVGEVVASEAQLPACRCERTASTVQRAANDHRDASGRR